MSFMNKNNSSYISRLITAHPLSTWIVVVLFVYFWFGGRNDWFWVKWLSGGSEGAKEIFAFADNPFMGLLMGILATSLIQSSSTVTSVIVGLCAGGLPINVAVPMIMGANVGTTVTNTLVSLGSVRNRQNFKRALAAATIHDFFNILAVIIFLPIEILFQPLQRIASFVTDFLTGSSRNKH